MPDCTACGAQNPSEAAFCLRCGLRLAGEEEPAATRRTVTVVFADVTGSTTLGEALDPEALRRVMARYYADARTALERHGGTVEKFIGDAVVAVFGVPRRHEDDAVRALRAAVEVRERVRALSAELEASLGQRLEIRTGVNTGEVVAGDLTEGASFASGDAMNVAARLEQAAAPDEILVGETTYRLVRDAVTVEIVPPLSLKGKAEPVSAWRVLAVDPTAAGLARRLHTPLVGRGPELQVLMQAFARTRAERHSELVTVLGQAGAGKSRLVRELIAVIEQDATVLRGRCLPYGEGITFWPIAEIIRDAAGIGDDEPAEAAREKIARLVGGHPERQTLVSRLADLLGLESQGAGAIQETFLALRSLFESMAAQMPLALVVDDIHWAEPTLLDFVEYLAGRAREAPILLVCISRPELVDERPGWPTPRERSTVLVLKPLSHADSEELVSQLLGDERAGDELAQRITRAAEGNPLYVEEFVRMLRDDRRLDGDHGNDSSEQRELVSPPTIEALLSARLDRLETEERGAVERAAVVGKVFWWGAVAELTAPQNEAAVGSSLQTLVRREFVVPEPSTFAGEEAFRFSHILMRDAAYGSIPKRARARFHAAFAEWLVRKSADRLAEYEEIVGFHFEQAFRYEKEVGQDLARTAELGEAASARLASSGRRAAQRADMRAAALLLDRASALAPQGVARLEIQLDLVDSLIEAADFARAEAILGDIQEDARRLQSDGIEARSTLLASWLESFVHPSGWRRTAGAQIHAAIDVLEVAGDEGGLAQAHWLLGQLHWRDLQATPTEVALEEALQHARRAGLQREEARILQLAAATAFFGPLRVPAAIARCEELERDAQGNPLALASIRLATGALHAMKEDVRGARADADQAKRTMEELGLPLALGEAAQFSGVIEFIAGDFARAEREFRSSYKILEEMGERSLLSTSAGFLAIVLCAEGRHDEAMQHTYTAEQTGDEDDVATQELWRMARAICLAHAGQVQPAEKLARQAVSLLEDSDFLNMHADALAGQAEVLQLAGKPDEAAGSLATALRLYEQKGNSASLSRARALLDELS